MKEFYYQEDQAISKVFGGVDDRFINHDTFPIFEELAGKGDLDFFIDYIEKEYSEGVIDTAKEVINKGKEVWADARAQAAIKKVIAKNEQSILELKKELASATNPETKKQLLRQIANLQAEIKQEKEQSDSGQATQTKTNDGKEATPQQVAQKEKFKTTLKAHLVKAGVTDDLKRRLAITTINNLIEMAKANKVGRQLFDNVMKLIKKEYDSKVKKETVATPAT